MWRKIIFTEQFIKIEAGTRLIKTPATAEVLDRADKNNLDYHVRENNKSGGSLSFEKYAAGNTDMQPRDLSYKEITGSGRFWVFDADAG